MRPTPILPKLLAAPTLATMLLLLPTVSAEDGAAPGEGQPPARGEQKVVTIDCKEEQCKVFESIEQTKQSMERTKQVENENKHQTTQGHLEK